MRHHDVSTTSAKNTAREIEIESIDCKRARGRAGAGSMQASEASAGVVTIDHMVAGLADGDQETAAELVGDDYRDEFVSKEHD